MLEITASQLRNREAGWVTRRDAAQQLGQIATEALSTLHEHLEEKDQDVRSEVRDAVRKVAKMFSSIDLGEEQKKFTLEECVKSAQKEGKRKLRSTPMGYDVIVTLPEGRTQTIHIAPFTWQDGTKLIRVHTRCGPISEDAIRWALRTNLKITHGAIAIAKEGDTEEFVITNCFLRDEITPEAIRASIKELAHYGDWIEKKLTGLDEL